jgi:hypothetical protein
MASCLRRCQERSQPKRMIVPLDVLYSNPVILHFTLDGNPSALPSAIYFLESCDLTASVHDNRRLVLRLDLFPQPNKTVRENYDSPFDKKTLIA